MDRVDRTFKVYSVINVKAPRHGHILTQHRNGAGLTGAPQALDELAYMYHWRYQNTAVLSEQRELQTNHLYHVWDAVNSANYTDYTDDIDDQCAYGTGAGQLNTSTLQTFLATANYTYDELGNLIRDRQEEIANIEWTVYGKIKAVTRTGTSTIRSNH